MATYEKAIPHILKWESGYVNDPDDMGGETYRGITRKNFPKWSGWAFIDEEKKKGEIEEKTIFQEIETKVHAFYKVEFWNKIYCDMMKDERVALFMFDWFVNSGYHAVRGAQRVLNITVDGVMGNGTLRAINNAPDSLFEALKQERINFLKGIVAKRPSQEKFLKGWLNRVNYYK